MALLGGRASGQALGTWSSPITTWDVMAIHMALFGTVSLSANSEQKFEALSSDDADGLNNPYINPTTKTIRTRFYFLDNIGNTPLNIYVDSTEFGIR